MFGRIPSLLGCLCAIVGGCAAPIVPAGNQFDGTYQGDGRLTRGFGYVCAVPPPSTSITVRDGRFDYIYDNYDLAKPTPIPVQIAADGTFSGQIQYLRPVMEQVGQHPGCMGYAPRSRVGQGDRCNPDGLLLRAPTEPADPLSRLSWRCLLCIGAPHIAAPVKLLTSRAFVQGLDRCCSSMQIRALRVSLRFGAAAAASTARQRLLRYLHLIASGNQSRASTPRPRAQRLFRRLHLRCACGRIIERVGHIRAYAAICWHGSSAIS